MAMDVKASSEPPLVHPEFLAEPPTTTASSPASDILIAPLDLVESPKKVRTKLRLCIILLSLYVCGCLPPL